MDLCRRLAGLASALAIGWTCGCDGGNAAALDDAGSADHRVSFTDGAQADGAGRDGAHDDDATRDGAPPTADAASSAEDAAGDAAPPGPLRLYLSPQGDDARDGSSESQAILTLFRAHAIIAQLKPQQDVELRIAPGTYYAQKVTWTFTMPNHEIKLMPLAGDKTRPVFDGCTKASATPADCPGGTWFRLKHSQGQQTNLHFWYIQVQRYGTAISLDGDRNAEASSNGGNRIFGCYFAKIGNVFNSQLAPSTAAVRLVNSDDNEIINSHFIDVVNTSSGALLHSLYVAHMSDRNQILRNRFKNGSGDPIRLRDFSNHNTIDENKIIKAGAAGYSDWYCDHEVRTDCTKAAPECPSWENTFRDNLLDGTYDCQPLQTFVYFQDETTAGCQPPAAGAVRLHTSGNTKTTTPCTN